MNRGTLAALLAALLCLGCRTTSAVAEKTSLGMSDVQVVKAVGKPLKKSAFLDEGGNTIEVWQYQETTWDDGGWSWDRTIVRSELTFRNGQLVAIGGLPDRYKNMNPTDTTVNIKQDVTVREEHQR